MHESFIPGDGGIPSKLRYFDVNDFEISFSSHSKMYMLFLSLSLPLLPSPYFSLLKSASVKKCVLPADFRLLVLLVFALHTGGL